MERNPKFLLYLAQANQEMAMKLKCNKYKSEEPEEMLNKYKSEEPEEMLKESVKIFRYGMLFSLKKLNWNGVSNIKYCCSPLITFPVSPCNTLKISLYRVRVDLPWKSSDQGGNKDLRITKH